MMENKIELVFLQTFEVASNTALHFADSQPLTKSSGLRLLQTHFQAFYSVENFEHNENYASIYEYNFNFLTPSIRFTSECFVAVLYSNTTTYRAEPTCSWPVFLQRFWHRFQNFPFLSRPAINCQMTTLYTSHKVASQILSYSYQTIVSGPWSIFYYWYILRFLRELYKKLARIMKCVYD